jgi:hypothetical protein
MAAADDCQSDMPQGSVPQTDKYHSDMDDPHSMPVWVAHSEL